MADFEKISEMLQKGKAKDVEALVKEAVDGGTPPGDILDKGLIAGMSVIGGKFKKNEVYVPEVLIAARAMNAGMKILEPVLAESGVKPLGTVAVGTVKNDLHDIGKNLVCMMLKGAGFEVMDLGIDVPPDKFVEAVKGGSQVVGLSALLTTTMPQMKTVIDALKEAGVDAKVMIGGAPVTQAYAEEIGADGYAPDAASAVDEAKKLIGAA
ncbi:MAG: corrinoid protein [Planctomycetota bacterium]|jgi:5-methyltetrahydrofolate--homocysteine methyltransferase